MSEVKEGPIAEPLRRLLLITLHSSLITFASCFGGKSDGGNTELSFRIEIREQAAAAKPDTLDVLIFEPSPQRAPENQKVDCNAPPDDPLAAKAIFRQSFRFDDRKASAVITAPGGEVDVVIRARAGNEPLYLGGKRTTINAGGVTDVGVVQLQPTMTGVTPTWSRCEQNDSKACVTGRTKSAELAWNTIPTAARYWVCAKESSSESFEAVCLTRKTAVSLPPGGDDCEAGTTTFEWTDDTEYQFKFIALSDNEASLYSDVSSATTIRQPTLPEAKIEDATMILTFDPVERATDYKVYFDVDGPGPPYNGRIGDKISPLTPSTATVGGKIELRLAGVRKGTKYYVTVRASNRSTNSESNYGDERPVAVPYPTPQNVKAKGRTGRVEISWDPVLITPELPEGVEPGSALAAAYETRYAVFYGTAARKTDDSCYDLSCGEKDDPGPLITKDTTAVVTGLDNGKEYFFSVRAQNNLAQSAYSKEVSSTPLAVPPNVVDTLGVDLPSDSLAVTFTFDKVDKATGYRFFATSTPPAGVGPTGPLAAFPTAAESVLGIPLKTENNAAACATTPCKVTVTGLAPNVTLKIAMTAVIDTGSESDLTSVKTRLSPPDRPALTVAGSTAAASLKWLSIPGAVQYKVYYSTASGTNDPAKYAGTGAGEGPSPIAAASTSATLTKLINATTYYLRVSASNSDGTEGRLSDQVIVTPLAAPTGFGLLSLSNALGPAHLTGQGPVKWDAVDKADCYKIQYGTSSGVYTSCLLAMETSTSSCPADAGCGTPVTATCPAAIAGTSRCATLPSLANSSAYYAVVSALRSGTDARTDSSLSSQITVLPIDKPANFIAKGRTGRVELSWNAVTGATGGYEIRWNNVSLAEDHLAKPVSNVVTTSCASMTLCAVAGTPGCGTTAAGVCPETRAIPVGASFPSNGQTAYFSTVAVNGSGRSNQTNDAATPLAKPVMASYVDKHEKDIEAARLVFEWQRGVCPLAICPSYGSCASGEACPTYKVGYDTASRAGTLKISDYKGTGATEGASTLVNTSCINNGINERCALSGLPSNSSYYLAAAAVTTAGDESDPMDEIGLTTLLPRVANFAVTLGTGKAVMTWDPVTGADSYQVFVDAEDADGCPPDVPKKVITSTSTSYTATKDGSGIDLVNGTRYCFGIVAVKGAPPLPASPPAPAGADDPCELTPDPGANSTVNNCGDPFLPNREGIPIAVPTGVVDPTFVGAGAGSTAKLTASTLTFQFNTDWTTTNSNGVDKIKIYYDTDSAGAPYTGIGAAEGTSPIVREPVAAGCVSGAPTLCTFTLSGLQADKTYYYAVSAANTINDSYAIVPGPPGSDDAESGESDLATNSGSARTLIATPTNLKVTTATSQATLTWNALTGLSGLSYRVYYRRETAAACTAVTRDNAGAWTTNYNADADACNGISGGVTTASSNITLTCLKNGDQLAVGESYCFSAVAEAGGNHSDFADLNGSSPPTVNAIPLSTPLCFSATANGTQVQLTWCSVKDATGYRIYYDTNSGTPYTGTQFQEGASPHVITSGSTTTQTFNLPSGSTPTTFYLAISAMKDDGDCLTGGSGCALENGEGESALSPEKTTTSGLDTPTGFAVTGETGASVIDGVVNTKVDWNAVTGATCYRVFYDTDTAGAPYVQTTGEGGVAATCEAVSATCESLAAAAGDPCAAGASTAGGLGPIPSTKTDLTLTGLTSGVQYHFSVKAFATSTESPYASNQSLIPLARPTLTITPMLVGDVVSGKTCSNPTNAPQRIACFLVNWSTVTGASQYTLYYDFDGSVPMDGTDVPPNSVGGITGDGCDALSGTCDAPIQNVPSSALPIIIRGVNIDKVFYFAVQAVQSGVAGNVGDYSVITSATTPFPAPTVLNTSTILGNANGGTETQIVVRWSPPDVGGTATNPATYEIHYKPTAFVGGEPPYNVAPSPKTGISGTAISAVVDGPPILPPNSLYYVAMRSVGATGPSSKYYPPSSGGPPTAPPGYFFDGKKPVIEPPGIVHSKSNDNFTSTPCALVLPQTSLYYKAGDQLTLTVMVTDDMTLLGVDGYVTVDLSPIVTAGGTVVLNRVCYVDLDTAIYEGSTTLPAAGAMTADGNKLLTVTACDQATPAVGRGAAANDCTNQAGVKGNSNTATMADTDPERIRIDNTPPADPTAASLADPPASSFTGQVTTTYTNTATVDVSITGGSDANGIAGWCLRETAGAPPESTCTGQCIPTFSNWTTSALPPGASGCTLTGADGLKSVYVWLKDNAGNVSAGTACPGATCAQITLDSTAPAGGGTGLTVDITDRTTSSQVLSDERSVSVSIAGAADAASGVSGYCLTENAGIPTAGSCLAASGPVDGTGWNLAAPTPQSDGVNVLTAGDVLKTARLWLRDGAGNVSTAAATDTITLDTGPPNDPIAITFTDPESGSTTVTNNCAVGPCPNTSLTLAFTDTPDVVKWCVTDDPAIATAATCPSGAWVALKPTTYTLPTSTEGARTVYVWVQDAAGQINTTQSSGSITLDRTAPPNASLALADPTPTTATYTNDNPVSATITGESGDVVRWCLTENAAAASETTCPSGTWATPEPTTFSLSVGDCAVPNCKTVYAWFKDSAGNVSAAAGSASITLDATAPGTPILSLADPTTFTGQGATTNANPVNTSITATDNLAVDRWCVSETQAAQPTAATCNGGTGWTTPAPATFSLTAGNGLKTVYLWVRDAAGNVNALPAVSFAITLDQAVPGNPALDASDPSKFAAQVDTYTNTNPVTASVTGDTDAESGISGWCLSETQSTQPAATNACFVGIEPTTFTLSGGDAAKTIYVWVRDGAGNVNVGTVSDAITLDLTAPTSGMTLTVADPSPAAGQNAATYSNSNPINATIAGESDATSGISGWCLSDTQTTQPTSSSCTGGTTWTTPEPTSVSMSGTGSPPASVTMYVWTRDGAGNVNASAVTAGAITFDTEVPAPSLTAPAASGADNATITTAFNIPENAISGTVKITFTRTAGPADIFSPHIITFNATFESAGAKSCAPNLVGGDLSSSACGVTGVSSDPNDTLIDGTTYTVRLAMTDLAGNAGLLDNTLWVYDTSPPGTPISAPDLDPASDSGTFNTDDITNITTPTFLGSGAPANTSVRIYWNGTYGNCAVTSDIGGNYSGCTISPALAGGAAVVYTITARSVDTAGNESPDSPALSITLDTVAPAPAPTAAPDLDAASDTGASSTDNITKTTTPTFSGSGAPPLEVVGVFVDGVKKCSVTALGGGTYSGCALAPALADGTYTITARSVDLAGNSSTDSPAMSPNLVIDTTAPAAGPTAAPDLDAASDSGKSATDNTTSDNTPTLSGSGADTNAYVTLYATGSPICTVTTDGTGLYSACTAAPALGDAAYTVTARNVDLAGNISPDSVLSLSLTIDTLAPAAPASAPDMTAASDSGTSSSDDYTNLTTPTFQNLTGSAVPNGQVRLYTAGPLTLRCTVDTNGAGDYSACTSSVLGEATYSFTARSVDLAGNEGTDSATLSVTIDTTALAVPTGAPDLDAASDSGTSSIDNITNITTPGFSGTGAPFNEKVRLYLNAAQVCETTAGGAGAWSCTSSALTENSYSAAARSVDLAGNESADSPTLNPIQIDTTGPAAPGTPDLQAASDSGKSSADNITTDTTPTFGGTGPINTIVRVYVGGSVRCTDTTDGFGAYSACTPGVAIAEATYNDVVARTRDAAGNESAASAALSPDLVIDTTAPAAPASAPDLMAASDSGSSSTDNITNDTTPSFENLTASAAPPPGQVRIYTTGPDTLRCTVDTTGLGDYTNCTSTALGEATHTVIARSVDAAGNEGPDSPSLNVTIDTTAPVAPAAPDLDPGSDSGSSTTDNITNATTPLFNGTGPATTTIRLYIGGTQRCSVTSGGGGAWSCTSSALGPASYANVVARSADTAGNESADSAAMAPDLVIDTTNPTCPAPTIAENPDINQQAVSTTTVWYNNNSTDGSFIVTVGATDSGGMDNVTFLATVSAGAVDSATPYQQTYNWEDAVLGPASTFSAASTVTCNDKAGNSSTNSFSVIRDLAAPAGGSISYTNGDSSSTGPTITWGTGVDAGGPPVSGIGSCELQRSVAAIQADGTCAAPGAFNPLSTQGTCGSSFVDAVAGGSCYQYKIIVRDVVYNEVTYSSGNTMRVDTTAPVFANLVYTPVAATPLAKCDVIQIDFTIQGEGIRCAQTAFACGAPSPSVTVDGNAASCLAACSDDAGNNEMDLSYSYTIAGTETTQPNRPIVITASDPAGNSASYSSPPSVEIVFGREGPCPGGNQWPRSTAPAADVSNAPLVMNLDTGADSCNSTSVICEIIAASAEGAGTNLYTLTNTDTDVFGPTALGGSVTAGSAAGGNLATGDAQGEFAIAASDGNLHFFEHNTASATPTIALAGVGANSTPAVGNIDGDGAVEVVVHGTSAGDMVVYAVEFGTGATQWSRTFAGISGTNAAPAIADVGGSAGNEVIVGTGNGQIRILTGATGLDSSVCGGNADVDGGSSAALNNSPVVANVDADGALEIIVASNDGKIHILDTASCAVTTRTIAGAPSITASVAVANVLGASPPLEIIVATQAGEVYILDGSTGSNASGASNWPVTGLGVLTASPMLADVDNDGTQEVVIARPNGQITAREVANGNTEADGWPIVAGTAALSSPTLANLDADSNLELVVGSADDKIYVFEITVAGSGTASHSWPTFQKNAARTGN
ncbi:MAG: VCBS repeat-containing protein [Nitrospirae bacterium]|nr:VCBS repeat-containing protein [Nitrospirota bacterium]